MAVEQVSGSAWAECPNSVESAHWSKLREILLHKTIYNKRDLRITVEGMLYRMRTGCPWRDLPEAFGGWSKVYKRFNAWSASGKWLKVFQALVADPDMEWVFIDGSYAKAHQHSAGCRR
ncbi:ISPs1, transposase OrfA [Pseudomonas fluorescens]|uniref:ISPs1, transposase OrfA n=1 Tax=Pseudomonas fluorescens TaxID=294 RepID=A0A379ICD1_PSEFL|nr:ISPs1, transposase OrfA [Pseudomonas fluorescens]